MARLSSVLEVLYLIFNEGYAATGETTGSGRASARMRCGWVGCCPSSRRGSPRCTVS